MTTHLNSGSSGARGGPAFTATVAAVEARALARRFGARWVLRGLSLRIEAGEAVALLGPNGSGKTTLLRVLSTLLRPSRGDARVYGYDVRSEPDRVRSAVGYLAHAPGLYDDLSAAENLRFSARMGGTHAAEVDRSLERVGLLRDADERVRGFSTGMRRRLALARILLEPRRLLLLDEPYAAFDAEGIALVNEVVRETTSGGGAVVMATHDLARALPVVSRALRMRAGRAEEAQVSDAPEHDALLPGLRVAVTGGDA